LPATDFAREAAELAGWFGPQTRLALRQCRNNLAPVAHCPELRWVHTLALARDWRAPDYTDEDMAALCESPFLNSIRRLDLAGQPGPARGPDQEYYAGLTAATCQRLSETRSLTHLEKLDFSQNPIGNDGVTILCDSARFGDLRVLNLERVGLTSRGAQGLLESSFPNLERLNLIGNNLRGRIRTELEARFGDRVQLDRTTRT
jgi:hypothetical protein